MYTTDIDSKILVVVGLILISSLEQKADRFFGINSFNSRIYLDESIYRRWF